MLSYCLSIVQNAGSTSIGLKEGRIMEQGNHKSWMSIQHGAIGSLNFSGQAIKMVALKPD